MNKYWVALPLLLITVGIGCNNNKTELSSSNPKKLNDGLKNNCALTIEELKIRILKKPLKNLNTLKGCFLIVDTLMYDDEADQQWKGKAFYKGKKISFIAETDLTDSLHVQRITLLDPSIKSKNGVGVGSTLRSMKRYISEIPTPNPDGYLSFNAKNDTNVYYYMKVDQYPAIADGRITDIGKMPADLKVLNIMINTGN